MKHLTSLVAGALGGLAAHLSLEPIDDEERGQDRLVASITAGLIAGIVLDVFPAPLIAVDGALAAFAVTAIAPGQLKRDVRAELDAVKARRSQIIAELNQANATEAEVLRQELKRVSAEKRRLERELGLF